MLLSINDTSMPAFGLKIRNEIDVYPRTGFSEGVSDGGNKASVRKR